MGRRTHSGVLCQCQIAAAAEDGAAQGEHKYWESPPYGSHKSRLGFLFMAEHDALIKVNLRTGAFEISGSEAFIEKMIETIAPLFPSQDELAAPNEQEEEKPSRGSGADRTLVDLGDFIAAKGITKSTSAEVSATAFVYYLTKVKGAQFCNKDEVSACYDEAGLSLPNNLQTTLNNLKNPDRKGYLASAGYGQYKLTVAGRNFVNDLGGE